MVKDYAKEDIKVFWFYSVLLDFTLLRCSFQNPSNGLEISINREEKIFAYLDFSVLSVKKVYASVFKYHWYLVRIPRLTLGRMVEVDYSTVISQKSIID